MKLTINGDSREVNDVRTVSDLLESLDINSDRVAVEINREVVPGDQYDSYDIPPESRVEIVTFVGGG